LIHKEFIEMSWKIKNPLVSAQPIATVATTQSPVHALGDIVIAEHPTYGAGEFIYLKGLNNTSLGSWVIYNASDWTTTLLPANGIGPVATALADTVTGTFGWYQISGKNIGKALTGFVDNANVYATATAGSVDDAIVAGDRVKLAKGASDVGTPAAGLAFFEIHRPFMDDGLAA
jgi:hypothetical protein